MILDKGICSLFRGVSQELSGEMPRRTLQRYFRSWYGELDFETSPARPTEGREERLTDARIRILQNRDIRQGDVAVLADTADAEQAAADGLPVYRITRAWHGKDDGSPTEITDLTLEVYEP